MNQVKIIIEGEHYKHKLIHFTLNHSNIESATICKSESVVAIRNGLRDFLYNIAGKSPQVLQIDNSSSATHGLIKDQSKRVFNDEYLEILKYYNIGPPVRFLKSLLLIVKAFSFLLFVLSLGCFF